MISKDILGRMMEGIGGNRQELVPLLDVLVDGKFVGGLKEFKPEFPGSKTSGSLDVWPFPLQPGRQSGWSNIDNGRIKMENKKGVVEAVCLHALPECFTFGGGYVIVSLLKKKFVDEYHWIENEEMLDLVAIAQSSPGAIAVNGAIVVGYKLAEWRNGDCYSRNRYSAVF